MNPNTGLAVLAGALVLITAYYAWTTRKLLGAAQDMSAATRDMVEVTSKIYALSVAPHVECRTTVVDGSRFPSTDAAPGDLVAETTVTNVGEHQVRLARVRLETDSQGELVRRFVVRWLAPNEREVAHIRFSPSKHTKVLVDLEDMAGQRHTIVAEPSGDGETH